MASLQVLTPPAEKATRAPVFECRLARAIGNVYFSTKGVRILPETKSDEAMPAISTRVLISCMLAAGSPESLRFAMEEEKIKGESLGFMGTDC